MINKSVSTKTLFVLGASVLFTYVLMVMGNFVTSTGSGLACPDWPLCYGSVAPPLKMDIWFEWGHRLLGGVSGLLILISAIAVWKNYRGFPRYAIITVAALVFAAVLMGGVIVVIEAPLLSSFVHIAVVSSHLILSTVVFICLVFAFRYVARDEVVQRNINYPILFGLSYTLIVVGILVRYSNATLACPDLPLCNGQVIPDLSSYEVAIHFFHRVLAVTTISMALYTSYDAIRKSSGVAASFVTVGLFLLQATFGILIVYTKMFFPVIVLHGATAFLLLGWLAYLSMPHIFPDAVEESRAVK